MTDLTRRAVLKGAAASTLTLGTTTYIKPTLRALGIAGILAEVSGADTGWRPGDPDPADLPPGTRFYHAMIASDGAIVFDDVPSRVDERGFIAVTPASFSFQFTDRDERTLAVEFNDGTACSPGLARTCHILMEYPAEYMLSIIDQSTKRVIDSVAMTLH